MRDAMAPSERKAASLLIIDKVCALAPYSRAKVVLTYMGFGSEIDTQCFFARIIADGKMAMLPRVDRVAQVLSLHAVARTSDLVTSKWGIQEPVVDANSVSIAAVDFVLLPGVAFDRAGRRLGYGRGYYDKLLSAADPALARVAAAFSCQIVDHVPVGPDDQNVHLIITENETIVTSHDR